ncbi:hypothetical protein NM208_g8515 [Fusarium decemcellulare]|uniref:Uncharacterized protein n=2 Tax=Fusarium decemcellulare TaxID=57161 RepID=A0ACC1S4D7_9HYPO|nr:hypothetical protein NM208_g8686 [Fusarium decemcellulare]KAJ3532273.1 hypothetical protein NM208_g8515 [Fusarium decemcellulare]
MRFPPLHLASLACWLLLFLGGAAKEKNNSTGVLEIDLVFPRNETYNPSPMMPIIFSYRNPGLVPLLKPSIAYEVWSYPNMSGPSISGGMKDPLANSSSSDPHIEFDFSVYPFNTEGTWRLVFHVRWSNCYEQPADGLHPDMDMYRINNTNIGPVVFTTKGPSKQIDLVAATSNQTCSAPAGVAINITGTMDTPVPHGDFEGNVCPVVASPPTKASSCPITLGTSAASSIDAEMTSLVCRPWVTGRPDGVDCESRKESIALRSVAGGATCLAFILGVLVYVHNLL